MGKRKKIDGAYIYIPKGGIDSGLGFVDVDEYPSEAARRNGLKRFEKSIPDRVSCKDELAAELALPADPSKSIADNLKTAAYKAITAARYSATDWEDTLDKD